MKVKVCFIADDGELLDTEAGCILHEMKINPEKYDKFHNGVIMRDHNGTVLNGRNEELCDDDAFYNAYSILVFDKEKANSFFARLKNEFDAMVPNSDIGIYVIDGMTWCRKALQIAGHANVINQLYMRSI